MEQTWKSLRTTKGWFTLVERRGRNWESVDFGGEVGERAGSIIKGATVGSGVGYIELQELLEGPAREMSRNRDIVGSEKANVK